MFVGQKIPFSLVLLVQNVLILFVPKLVQNRIRSQCLLKTMFEINSFASLKGPQGLVTKQYVLHKNQSAFSAHRIQTCVK